MNRTAAMAAASCAAALLLAAAAGASGNALSITVGAGAPRVDRPFGVSASGTAARPETLWLFLDPSACAPDEGAEAARAAASIYFVVDGAFTLARQIGYSSAAGADHVCAYLTVPRIALTVGGGPATRWGQPPNGEFTTALTVAHAFVTLHVLR